MAASTDPARRTVLAAGGVGLAAVLVACGGSATSTGGTTADDGAASSDGSGASGEVPGASGEESGALAAATEVPVGGALAASLDSGPVLVTQPTEGEFRAFSAVCPHAGCTVQPGDGELRCPCHASRFDLATGEVLGGPAPSPLPEIAVTVADGQVLPA